ncbi:regulatory signaling modulator protein AmpE [Zooshikella ganghwensis]|uniref:Regulatory signaling modulator protein AmpE n=1 Tax=Zooshikella ganghwensis TaxID=202772 RepID=A0A4V1INZ0_9GAMM|nr:regulatory signaling modulator protein AmpE [Zooshikella ganghwensis]RDH45401.1 hypothetical protein B9G39_19180 [Zooshikella ganghwensis]
MLFLEIFIAFGCCQLKRWRESIHHDSWYFQWLSFLMRLFKVKLVPDVRLWCLAWSIPLLGLAALTWLLEGFLWNAPLVLLNVLVLLYSFGRHGFVKRLDRVLAIMRTANPETLFIRTEQIFPEFAQQKVTGIENQYILLRRQLFYDALQQLITVVFWFVLLGPWAALLYRLNALYIDYMEKHSPALVRASIAWDCLYLLEWLPARLLAASFTLSGNFAGAYHELRHIWANWTEKPGEFVARCGLQALSLPLNLEEFVKLNHWREQQQLAVEELMAIRDLLMRTLVVWAAGLAILVIGWHFSLGPVNTI